MNNRRKGISILAAASFLVFLAGAGFSETTDSDSHQAHHPQGNQETVPAVAGCLGQSPMMGGMMGGMMSGRMSGMMGGSTPAGNSLSDCGTTSSEKVPASPQTSCGHGAGHGCTNAPTGT